MKPIILIVDDDLSLRSAVAELLDAAGFSTVQAANGYDAIQQMEIFNPSLILTGLLLPIMDGLDLLKTIQSSHLYNHIPLVFLLSSPEDALRLRNNGWQFADFIQKPIDPIKLKQTVLKHLPPGNS